MQAQADRAFQGRQNGLGARHLRRGAGHVQIARQTRIEAHLGEMDRVALGLDIAFVDGEALLGAAQFQVVASDLRQHRYQGIASALLRRPQHCGRGLQFAALAAKDVDLPGRVKTELVDVRFKRGDHGGTRALPRTARRGRRRANAAQALGEAAAQLGHAGGGVDRGQQAGLGYTARRACLGDSLHGDFEVQIAGGCALDQPVEGWVLKLPPPVLHAGWRGDDPRV